MRNEIVVLVFRFLTDVFVVRIDGPETSSDGQDGVIDFKVVGGSYPGMILPL